MRPPEVGEKRAGGRARDARARRRVFTDRFLAARSLVGQALASRLVDPSLTTFRGPVPGSASSDYATRDASRNNVEIGETALQRLVKDTRDRSLLKALRVAAVDFRQRNDISPSRRWPF